MTFVPGRLLLDVLWGQPNKLIQVAFTSELLENQQNDLVFFKIISSYYCRASEASKVDCFKIKYEKFGPKIEKRIFWWPYISRNRIF